MRTRPEITESPTEETAFVRAENRRGRGARSNASGRHEAYARVSFDDGWHDGAAVEGAGGAQTGHHEADEDDIPPLRTTVTDEHAKTIITRNISPDIPFDRSINPYRGCEHGCIYCYARPSHANMGLSPGLDFETRLFAKPNAADLLRKELARPRYRCRPIAIGTNTDPYQPVEKDRQIMRRLLEVLDEASHPVTIITKSALIGRDLDILSAMAQRNLVKVALSVTTLDHRLSRRMEPRASTPGRRLQAISELAKAGIRTGVMVAPVIPSLNDHEIEGILAKAYEAGAREAGWVMLRLPLEIKDLFAEWLAEEAPERADRVMGLVKNMRNGRLYDTRFMHRMRGQGAYADMISKRFRLAVKKLGFNMGVEPLDCMRFVAPRQDSQQMSLFL
ncbi:PA0069 family radical SAM protein [Iodidimonas gelatinilytica]|nr:PA0069 family radical SAM protein [Iodidimonas gelatinilytica]